MSLAAVASTAKKRRDFGERVSTCRTAPDRQQGPYVLQRRDGEIDIIGARGLIDFFGERALAADLGKQAVSDGADVTILRASTRASSG